MDNMQEPAPDTPHDEPGRARGAKPRLVTYLLCGILGGAALLGGLTFAGAFVFLGLLNDCWG